jgi:hypothetical protein
MEEAVSGAEIIVPVNWAPFSFLEKRTELSDANLGTYIDLLEHELRENNKEFIDWEVTEEMMEKTKDGKALLMHDLPADITDISCIRGEMTAQVYNANLQELFNEAGMPPYVIAAMIILAKSSHKRVEHTSLATINFSVFRRSSPCKVTREGLIKNEEKIRPCGGVDTVLVNSCNGSKAITRKPYEYADFMHKRFLCGAVFTRSKHHNGKY